MGTLLNLQDGRSTAADRRLTRPDTPAGFFSCIAVHRPPRRYLSIWAFSPPLRVRRPERIDIAVILAIWPVAPCLGNLALTRFIDRVRKGPTSPRASRQINRRPGAMPITVGLITPLA